MKKLRKNTGITLIALVVTIVILLILAGVSISMLTGHNGILTQAQNTKEETEIASEKEAIQLTIINKESTDNSKYDIGEELRDRTLSNGDNWKIVSVNETKEIYGTGWKYVDKGTNLENYGETKYKWVINEETGDVVRLPDEVTKLSYGDNLGVKDGIVLNVDPINMGDNSSWGDGVTLYGVEEGDGYGWNGTEFKFDGQNDYIEVYTDGVNIDSGITFEFYCSAPNGRDIFMLGKTIRNPEISWTNKFRMQFLQSIKRLNCCMSGLDSMSDWKENNILNKHWIKKNVEGNFQGEDGGYITVTADIKNNKVAVYWNGEFKGETTCSHDWMINGGLTDSSIPFTIGLVISGTSYSENYSEIDLYACRLYNKVLTSEEIKDNYNKTVTYHNVLVQDENK